MTIQLLAALKCQHNTDCIEKAEHYFDVYGKQVSAVSTGVSDTGVNNPA